MDDKTIITIVVMKKIVLIKWYDTFNQSLCDCGQIFCVCKKKNAYCFVFRVMFNVAMPMWLTMETKFSNFAFLF